MAPTTPPEPVSGPDAVDVEVDVAAANRVRRCVVAVGLGLVLTVVAVVVAGSQPQGVAATGSVAQGVLVLLVAGVGVRTWRRVRDGSVELWTRAVLGISVVFTAVMGLCSVVIVLVVARELAWTPLVAVALVLLTAAALAPLLATLGYRER